MTRVTIRADCMEISSHSPQPVVCHGISAVSQMTANYLEKYGTATIKRSDGYLKICDIIRDEYSLFVLEAFQDALKDIANEYPGLNDPPKMVHRSTEKSGILNGFMIF